MVAAGRHNKGGRQAVHAAVRAAVSCRKSLTFILLLKLSCDVALDEGGLACRSRTRAVVRPPSSPARSQRASQTAAAAAEGPHSVIRYKQNYKEALSTPKIACATVANQH